MFIRTERSWLGTAAAGMIGAAVVTALQYWMRENIHGAPRVDRVGERALARGLRRVGIKPPRGKNLTRAALAAEIVANTLFFGWLVSGKRHGIWRRGLLWGLAAGSAVPPFARQLGVQRRAMTEDPTTRALTAGMYTAGGVASAAASRFLAPAPF